MVEGYVEEKPVSLPRSQEDGLNQYLRKIRKYPMLTQEEEYEYVLRWQKYRDSQALKKLVNSHLKLVAKIASGYLGYGLPYSDLISEGSIGVMQALDRFDSERGFRFSTYASWWIKAAIKEYVLKSWSMVKLGTTSSQKKLFFQLRKLKHELRSTEGEGLPDDYIEQIAKELNVSRKDVEDMNQRMAGPDYSLNTPISTEEGGEWQDWLEDEKDDQETILVQQDEQKKRSALLEYALEYLNDREYIIFTRRNLAENPPTLAVIANEYGLSRERVRQIEAKAYDKVQKAMRKKAVEMRIPWA